MADGPARDKPDLRRQILTSVYNQVRMGRGAPTAEEILEAIDAPDGMTPAGIRYHLTALLAEGKLTSLRTPTGQRRKRALALTADGLATIGQVEDPRDVVVRVARAHLLQLPYEMRAAVEAVG